MLKDLSEILHNRTLVTTSLIPAIIFLIIPLLVGIGGTRNARSGRSPTQISELMVRMSPELQGLPEKVLLQIYMFRQFVIFLLIMPTMTALVVAVYGIIGEKQARSLEPLLATPITPVQLLIAKSLSSAIPAIMLTWILFALYVASIGLFAFPQVLPNVLTPITIFVVGVIAPLIAILGLSLGVIVSSRSNDPRTAQQIGGLIILPIVGLFAAQLQGAYLLTLQAAFAIAAGLVVVDLVVLGIGVSLFERETILIRWK